MASKINIPLTWRPIVPGSDQHLALLGRTRSTQEQLGRLLYPSLYERRDGDAHRRACDAIASAAAKLTPTKQDAPDRKSEASTAPRSIATGIEDGCSTECA